MEVLRLSNGARGSATTGPLAALALSVAVLSSCAAAGSVAPASPVVTVTAPALEPSSAESARILLLDGDLADRQAQTTQSGEDTLVGACMRAQSFNYAARPYARDDTPLTADFTVEAATINGYGHPSTGAEAQNISDLYHEALLGQLDQSQAFLLPIYQEYSLNTRGCLAEARIQIYGSLQDAARVFFEPQVIGNSVATEAAETPAYAVAVDAWSRCMSNAHFDFSSPLQAKLSAADDPGSPSAVLLATADARCRHDVHLLETLRAAATPIIDRLDTRIVAELGEVEDLRRTACTKAQNLASD